MINKQKKKKEVLLLTSQKQKHEHKLLAKTEKKAIQTDKLKLKQ